MWFVATCLCVDQHLTTSKGKIVYGSSAKKAAICFASPHFKEVVNSIFCTARQFYVLGKKWKIAQASDLKAFLSRLQRARERALKNV